MKSNHRNSLITATIVFVLLVVISVYYLSRQNEGRDSSLIGDVVCDSLSSGSSQDACCAKIHRDDIVIACVGSWNYLDGMNKCQYLCEGQMPACTLEAKICPDGSSKARNSSNECEFDSCN